jgi:hypothetical protein
MNAQNCIFTALIVVTCLIFIIVFLVKNVTMNEPKYQIGDRLYLANLPVKIINLERSHLEQVYLYVVSFDCFPQMVTLVTEHDLFTQPLPPEESFDLSDWLDD